MSSWQLQIDWNKVKAAGVRNAYIRATWGLTGIDSQFGFNRQHATIPRSFYHLFKGIFDGRAQADHFLNTIQEWTAGLPPAIDVEPVTDDTSNVDQRTEQLKRMVERMVERIGIFPIIYTGLVWNGIIASKYDAYFANCSLWDAFYNDTIPEPSPLPRPWIGKQWWLWQYTSSGQIDGISTRVDLNRFNPNHSQFIDQQLGAGTPKL